MTSTPTPSAGAASAERATAVPALRFDVDAAQAAADAFGFNCGPGAIAALLSLTPGELRPHLGDFKAKGYMNAPMVMTALRSLGRPFSVIPDGWPRFGLVRIQFEGPWLDPGVPFGARCWHTHWVAVISEGGIPQRIFDINGTCSGWLPYDEWAYELVPWLLEDKKRATGGWHLTHRIEVADAATPRPDSDESREAADAA